MRSYRQKSIPWTLPSMRVIENPLFQKKCLKYSNKFCYFQGDDGSGLVNGNTIFGVASNRFSLVSGAGLPDLYTNVSVHAEKIRSLLQTSNPSKDWKTFPLKTWGGKRARLS